MPVPARNDQVTEVIGVEATEKTDRVLAPSDAGQATGRVDGAADRIRDVGHLYAQCRGAIGIETDEHQALALTAQVDSLHAVDLQQPRLDGRIDDALEVRHIRAGSRNPRMDQECGNRKVPATDLDFGFLGVGRQLFGAVQRIQHVKHRLLQIRTDVEAQVDVAVARAHIARHLDDTGYLAQRVFLRLDDAGFDFLRCRVAPRGVDVYLGILEIRQHLYRQRGDADQAEYEQQNGSG